MATRSEITVVTDRGQASIPAHLRREMDLSKGRRLLWQKTGDRELTVVVLEGAAAQSAQAMRGFARRFRPQARRTEDWMRELREGES